MKACFLPVWAIGLAALGAACGRDIRTATHHGPEGDVPPPMRVGCNHAVCGDGFFVDVGSTTSCRVGAICTMALTLVATGDYHINEQYPYKFKADEQSGVEFLGTDGAGKNVFSKAAKNWAARDEKTGTMTVAFKPVERGTKPIGGVFKLSVCSTQNCQLEQQQVTATVEVS